MAMLHGLQSMGVSVVEAHRINYLGACGILVPRPGIEPASPALQGRLLITGPPREVPTFDFLPNCRIVFHSGCTAFTLSPAIHKGSDFSWYSISIFMYITLIVKWYVIVVLTCTCIFLEMSDVEPLYVCTGHLFWKNVYSSPLCIFELGCLVFVVVELLDFFIYSEY